MTFMTEDANQVPSTVQKTHIKKYYMTSQTSSKILKPSKERETVK
jgi:hypothetical protein